PQGGCPSPCSLSWPVSLQSDSLVVCDVDPALTEKLRKFRFRKETNNAAILMKIDKERQLVVLEEEFQVGTFHSFLPATFGKPSSVK
uniref:Glia maturation factor gamma n=1 Tax=Terrapene triunguis TaxID=2587831 RepID=A0A674J6S6_9SAUR